MASGQTKIQVWDVSECGVGGSTSLEEEGCFQVWENHGKRGVYGSMHGGSRRKGEELQEKWDAGIDGVSIGVGLEERKGVEVWRGK